MRLLHRLSFQRVDIRGGNWYVFINIDAIVDSAYRSIPYQFSHRFLSSSLLSSAPKATILFFAFIFMFYVLREEREPWFNALNEDVESPVLRGFSRDKKQVVSKIKGYGYTLAFVHLNS